MSVELKTILFGLSCGLTAGFAPGPLLALVVSQTLRYDFQEGLKIAIAPALTDLPVLAVALLVISRVEHFNPALGVISLAGALVVSYMALSNFRVQTVDFSQAGEKPKSILQGMATNFFQPHPHIFWFTVGAPAILAAWAISHAAGAGFVVAFLSGIVGAKIVVAFLVKRSKGVLPLSTYHWILRGLGAAMLVFAVLLARDGMGYLGMLKGTL